MAYSDKEIKIATMLNNNVKPSEISNVMDITISRISQLCADEKFKNLRIKLEESGNKVVSNTKEGEVLSKDELYNTKLDDVGKKLLDKIEKSINLFIRPSDLLGAFKIVSTAPKRGNISGTNITNNQVILQLPSCITDQAKPVDYKTNSSNEIIEVDNLSLIAESSKSLKKEVYRREETNKLLESLPPTLDELPIIDSEEIQKDTPQTPLTTFDQELARLDTTYFQDDVPFEVPELETPTSLNDKLVNLSGEGTLSEEASRILKQREIDRLRKEVEKSSLNKPEGDNITANDLY